MKKLELEKNRLDLSYKRNLQLLNATLLVGAGSFITYLAGLILNQNKGFEYTLILSIIIILTYIIYQKINNRLKEISARIKDLC
jgi:exosortase/archaeosortase